MSVTEAERHHLYESVKHHLGAESATILMNLIPPTDWSGVATRADIARLEHRFDGVDGRLAALDARFVAVNERLDGFAGRFRSVDDHLAGMNRRLVAIDERLDTAARTFGTWLFASQAGVIAAVALIVALVR